MFEEDEKPVIHSYFGGRRPKQVSRSSLSKCVFGGLETD
jgi:hypothetical protein